MEIPSLVFIGIGIVIAIVSYFTKMYFFILIAVIFAVYGLYKLIRTKLVNRFSSGKMKELKTIDSFDSNFSSSYNTSSSKPSSSHTTNTLPCPKCGLKHYRNANYCQNCGTRLK